jgi:hypothetical protein
VIEKTKACGGMIEIIIGDVRILLSDGIHIRLRKDVSLRIAVEAGELSPLDDEVTGNFQEISQPYRAEKPRNSGFQATNTVNKRAYARLFILKA